MPKLARAHPTAARPKGPTATTDPTWTHEAGTGHAKDLKTELFTLAVTNFVSEDTFYESANTRDTRFAQLVVAAAEADPEWTAGLIGWLRSDANMRTASIIAACEMASVGAPGARQVVDAACQRAEEPAEVLAYWRGTYGRKLAYAVKRGVADAVVRLYNERSAVKWDSAQSPMRMGDVVDIVHPRPRNATQAALFQWLLDRRHNRDNPRGLDRLPALAELLDWRKEPTLDALPKIATWENTSAYFKADAAFWEALIPRMGYMALLRNLRNFEDAGVDVFSLAQVQAKLVDPAEVAASRQLPYRFWSAWKHSGSMTFGPALEVALDLAVDNIPGFAGRSLVLVDTSGSMQSPMSAKSKMARVEAAAVFGAAVAKRNPSSTLVMYATEAKAVKAHRSAIRTAEAIIGSIGVVGHGTNTWPATIAAWQAHGPFDRILIFTDAQDHPSRLGAGDIPASVPIFVWDLAGYKAANLEPGRGRYLLGGVNDKSFKLVEMLERGTDAGWPWEYASTGGASVDDDVDG